MIETGRDFEILVKGALVGCAGYGVLGHDISETCQKWFRVVPGRRAFDVIGRDDERDVWIALRWSSR